MFDDARGFLEKNTEWFDIFYRTGGSTKISFKNNEFYSLGESEYGGYGIRVKVNGRIGFSCANDPAAVMETAKRACTLAAYGECEEFSLPAKIDSAVCEPYSAQISSFDTKKEISAAAAHLDTVTSELPSALTDINVSCGTHTTRLINSNGFDASYRSSIYSASVSIEMLNSEKSRVETYGQLLSREPGAYSAAAYTAIENCRMAQHTVAAPGGKLPVIFTPNAAAQLISIVTNGLHAASIYKGISFFTDKIGSKLFAENFSLSDNPLDEQSVFSFPFDDEGTPARAKMLIENGVVSDYIADLKYAARLKRAPSGNASRGYSSLPSASLSLVSIPGGDVSYNELVSSCRRGILAESFLGLGQSNTLAGDFSAKFDLAYVIENGKIIGRADDSMLSGNIFSLLAGDVVFTSDRVQSGNMLMPYMFFNAVDVSA